MKTDKKKQYTFTIRHDISTKVLLDKIQRLKILTEDSNKRISQGSIIRNALDLLASDMDLKKLEIKYKDFIKHINEESIINK